VTGNIKSYGETRLSQLKGAEGCVAGLRRVRKDISGGTSGKGSRSLGTHGGEAVEVKSHDIFGCFGARNANAALESDGVR